jgi:hypothetical protein
VQVAGRPCRQPEHPAHQQIDESEEHEADLLPGRRPILRNALATPTIAGFRALQVWRAGTTSALDRESIAGSRDVGAAAAFSRQLGGQVLSFTVTNGQVRDKQTGSVWDQFGRATAGPLAGSRLTPADATDSFWFDWAAFHADTAVWTG